MCFTLYKKKFIIIIKAMDTSAKYATLIKNDFTSLVNKGLL